MKKSYLLQLFLNKKYMEFIKSREIENTEKLEVLRLVNTRLRGKYLVFIYDLSRFYKKPND